MTKLVGFGCSWMYGSELENPEDDNFLNLLGPNDNFSEPGNTIHGIFHTFMEYQYSHKNEDVIYVFALTDASRQSWYDNADYKWKHSTWIQHNDDYGSKFYEDFKNYVVNSDCEQLRAITHRSLALSMINSCKAHNCRYIMFNSLPNPATIQDNNFLWPKTSMIEALTNEQSKGKKIYLYPGGHPTSTGHKWVANKLKDFIDNRYPGLL